MRATFTFSHLNINVDTVGSLVWLEIIEPPRYAVTAASDDPADGNVPVEPKAMRFGLTKSAARSIASAMMGAAAEL